MSKPWSEVHQAAKCVFSTLNVTMSKNADADPVTHGAVVEFVPDGPPRKHHFVEVEPIPMRMRVGLVTRHGDGRGWQGDRAEARALPRAGVDACGGTGARYRRGAALPGRQAGLG